jgi:two-component system, chemotaxis family, sensor kinase Cph1
MSFCILRAMSTAHDEYLRNLGVIASMSISIIKDGRLWGLIACHHTQPKWVPHSVRITCEVLARIFSCGIAAAEDEDERLRVAEVRDLSHSISANLGKGKNVAGQLDIQGEAIRSAMRAEGLALYVHGKLSVFGLTPQPSR